MFLFSFAGQLIFKVLSRLFTAETSTPLTETQTNRRPRFLSPKRSKRNAEMNCPKTVTLPGVTSLKGAHSFMSLPHLDVTACIVNFLKMFNLATDHFKCVSHVNVSEWKCFVHTDLEDIFQQSGIGRRSLGMTYQDLRKVLGTAAPRMRTLECYDVDGDQRYSLMELKAAAGLWAQQWTVLKPSGVWCLECPHPFLWLLHFCELSIYHTDCGTVALACPPQPHTLTPPQSFSPDL